MSAGKTIVFSRGTGRIIDYHYQPSGENKGWIVTLNFRQDQQPFTPDAFMYGIDPHLLPQMLLTLAPKEEKPEADAAP